MPNSVSITAGKKTAHVEKHRHVAPEQGDSFSWSYLSGHNHDYTMLKQEFPPEVDWFTDLRVRVDLGYLGIQSDYRGDQIDIPAKKPRKSQKNPNPQLSEEQKLPIPP